MKETLQDYGKATSPLIDTTAFPGTVAANYWSSTAYAPVTDNAWIIGFFSGNIATHIKTNGNYVRCVSGP